jgi:hypothetical protein
VYSSQARLFAPSLAPPALRRIGKRGDGSLGGFLTPAEARGGREEIQRAAKSNPTITGDWPQPHGQLDARLAAGLAKFVSRRAQ